MALEEALLALASLAGRTVVAAASTDAWAAAKRGFARLLGRGDPQRIELAEQRLEQVHAQLADAVGADLEQEQDRLAAAWQTRVSDLLEEHPELSSDLWAWVEQVQAQLPARTASATGHGVAASRDVIISALNGGVAAGTIHGNVAPSNPTLPGSANR